MAEVLASKYELGAEIGRGGFGVVYRARDSASGAEVAVKMFRPQPGNAGSDSLERFKREAQSSDRFSHPNATAVLDAGVGPDGTAFFVMELLTGETLKDELKAKGTLTLPRARAIAVPVLDALAAAHAAHIIHRDIKPENIFLHRSAAGEVVKVLDFGLAKARLADTPLTATGTILGTPAYMAPERMKKFDDDGRSDVYSVATLLYEMLAGRPPFGANGESLIKVVMMQMQKAPEPLAALAPSVPAAAAETVMAGLNKDPAKRPTAAAYATQVRETFPEK